MPTNLRFGCPAAFLLLLLAGAGPALAQSWSPPLGIPAPPFGITQVAPSPPSPWTAGVAGFYYVDEAASGATDTSNPYGWPAKPRRTMPSSLPAGAVVELHGTYTKAHTSPSNIVAAGTSAKPVFIRGASASTRPTITKSWEVSGTYLVMENLTFAFTGPGLYLLAPSSSTALRRSEVRGNLGDGGIEVVSWGSGSVSNAVIYGNLIHDNGDVNATYDQDVHGILVGSQASNVWIVDNELYRNSGDGVQINGSVSSTHHIYVGRNVSHQNKQAGFWTKTAADVVFSENRAYGHRPSNSSSGQGMGFQYDPQRVWFLFNECYDNTLGINSGSSNSGGRSGVYLIGNVLRNNLYAGVQLNGSVSGEYVIGNTFYSNPIGLDNGYSRIGLEISDNIFSKSSTAHISFRDYGSGATSNLRYSLFDAPVKIVWDDVTRDVAGMQGIGECGGCKTGDPLFVNPAASDLELLPGSPALDAGVLEGVYATFQSLYGIDIRRDKAGRIRPDGPAWDIGAYESPAVIPDVSVADAAGPEGNAGLSPLGFVVTLSEPSSRTVTVTYATVDGTAKAGTDYQSTSGTLLFPPGVVSQTIEVGVRGDYVYELDEQFTLRLTGVTLGVLARSEAAGTIENDDSPGLTIADASAVERAGAVARFVVTLAPAQGSPVTVSYATANGTATAGSDYQASSGLLTFPAGATEQPIDVPVYEDSLVERSETFTVALSGASGSPIVRSPATGLIFDAGAFFTLAPCRLVDTRNAAGTYGGPALAAKTIRNFPLAGRCGVPTTARAVAINVTATGASINGHFRVYASGATLPLTSTLNYQAGRTVANNAVVPLGTGAGLAVYCSQASGTAHLVVDVSGYFE